MKKQILLSSLSSVLFSVCLPVMAAQNTMTREELSAHLSDLFVKNVGENVVLCDADVKEHTCKTSDVSLLVQSGVAAMVSIPSVTVVAAEDKGDKPTDAVLAFNVRANASKPKCHTANAQVFSGKYDNASMAVDTFSCAFTSGSDTQMNMNFVMDYVDFDKGEIGSYYALNANQAMKGAKTGYALLKFKNGVQGGLVNLTTPVIGAQMVAETVTKQVTTTQQSVADQAQAVVAEANNTVADTKNAIDQTADAMAQTVANKTEASSQAVASAQNTATQTTTADTTGLVSDLVAGTVAGVVAAMTTDNDAATAQNAVDSKQVEQVTLKEVCPSDWERNAAEQAVADAIAADLEAQKAANLALQKAGEAEVATGKFAQKKAEEARLAEEKAMIAAQMASQARIRAKADAAVVSAVRDNGAKEVQICTDCVRKPTATTTTQNVAEPVSGIRAINQPSGTIHVRTTQETVQVVKTTSDGVSVQSDPKKSETVVIETPVAQIKSETKPVETENATVSAKEVPTETVVVKKTAEPVVIKQPVIVVEEQKVVEKPQTTEVTFTEPQVIIVSDDKVEVRPVEESEWSLWGGITKIASDIFWLDNPSGK